MKRSFCYFLIALIYGCSVQQPLHEFDAGRLGQAPDYSNLNAWVAHPDKMDESDRLPRNYTDDAQPLDGVDVFFIYPTLYLKGGEWNADVNDAALNKVINRSTIRHQAGVFGGLAKVYAPLYRQMHIHGYRDSLNGSFAFEVAYKDVEQAFEYYWENYNSGNDVVLVAHSQGTNHAERLLKEKVLKTETMKERLLLAYMVGMPIQDDFSGLPPCKDPEELGCFLSWRAFADGHYPHYPYGSEIQATNPITWRQDTAFSAFEDHKGILFANKRLRAAGKVKARVQDGLLWVAFGKIPFKGLYTKDNYHIADFNLFWLNIRENFMKRMEGR